jgi:hypothetical protein
LIVQLCLGQAVFNDVDSKLMALSSWLIAVGARSPSAHRKNDFNPFDYQLSSPRHYKTKSGF